MEVTRELTLYFQENDKQDCDPGSLWEVHKTVLRGVLTKHGVRIKRSRNEQLAKLLAKLAVVEARHKHAPSRALESELGLIAMLP